MSNPVIGVDFVSTIPTHPHGTMSRDVAQMPCSHGVLAVDNRRAVRGLQIPQPQPVGTTDDVPLPALEEAKVTVPADSTSEPPTAEVAVIVEEQDALAPRFPHGDQAAPDGPGRLCLEHVPFMGLTAKASLADPP